MQQPQAGLEIDTTPPSWLVYLSIFTIYLFQPKIVLDGGQPIPAKWGVNHVPVMPGRHAVKVYWPAYWFIPSNVAEVSVDAPQGQVAQLRYHVNWLFFLPGSMEQTGVRTFVQQQPTAVPQTAAGWHPDPAGKHELRYWDGSAWTDDVSDGGVAAKDSLAS